MKELTLPSGNLLMFEDKSHTYRIGTEWESGKRVPGSHEIMEKAEVVEPMNEYARKWVERGQRVHSATELDDLGDFNDECAWAKGPEFAYLQAWRQFKAENPEFAAPDKIEELVGNEDYWAATLVDRAYNDGFRILQIKTGEPAKYHPVQTAIEGLLCYPSAGMIERYCVYLASEPKYGGKPYDLKLHDDQGSMNVALKILGTRQTVRKYMTTRKKRTKELSAK